MPLSLSHQKKEAGACEAPVSFFMALLLRWRYLRNPHERIVNVRRTSR